MLVQNCSKQQIPSNGLLMSKLDTIIDLIKHSSHTLTGIFEKGKDHCRNKLDRESTVDPEANESALSKAVQLCAKEIDQSDMRKGVPSPKYFEHVAMLSRQTKNYENEIAICEMYLDVVTQYATKYKLSKKKIASDIKPLCDSMIMRINNAKVLSSKQ